MISIILFSLFGAAISRLHGGGFITGVPKVVRNLLWCLPLAGAAAYIFYGNGHSLLGIVSAAMATAGLCFLGKTTGHGGGMDLGSYPDVPGDSREIEKLEYLIYPLYGRINVYWYDALLLAITGLAGVSGLVAALCFTQPFAALIVGISGIMKSLAYIIGWKVSDTHATEIGEALTGLFAYAAVACVIWL